MQGSRAGPLSSTPSTVCGLKSRVYTRNAATEGRRGVEGGCRPLARPPRYRRLGPLPRPARLGSASGPNGSGSPPQPRSSPPRSLRPQAPPGAASPPPSLRRILRGAGLRLEAAAPSGRPPGSAGLRTAGGSDDAASRVLPPTLLSGATVGKSSAPRAGSREPGAESLARERASPRFPASFPGRHRARPLRPNCGTAARAPTEPGVSTTSSKRCILQAALDNRIVPGGSADRPRNKT